MISPPSSWRRGPDRSRARLARPGERSEWVLVAVIGGITGLSLLWWVAGGVAMVLSGHGWHEVALARAPVILARFAAHPAPAASAWPARLRPLLGPGVLLYACVAGTLAIALGSGAVAARLSAGARYRSFTGARRGATASEVPASWATRGDLATLKVAAGGAGRVVVGRCRGRLVAVEANHSLLVAGPTQAGKTSGLAAPAILEWDGPVVATSVKTDLLRDTLARRSALGEVLVYDPTGVSGQQRASWSPLRASRSWQGALQSASGLCGVARSAAGGLEDGAFWYATAEKLIAPLLFAAATSGASMGDVVRWVDTAEEDEVLLALEQADEPAALRAAMASFGREDRQRSSVYTTAETVLAAFADPRIAASTRSCDIRPEKLVDGSSSTLYLVAPAHDQQRLAPVFVAILKSVLEGAFEQVSRCGRPLRPSLLVVLDEAASIAPLDNLDALASTAAGHGVSLLTVFQDLAQVKARYGQRWATVVNNHRAKIVCPGIADPSTLEHFSRLIGDVDEQVGSVSVDAGGHWTRSTSPLQRRLAPADRLRRLGPGEAVLVYGNLPPARLSLRLLHEDRYLRALAGGRDAGRAT